MVKNKKCQKVTDCRSSNVNKPQLISGTKKRKKTIPMTRDERSIIEITKARRNVQLCIPKLSFTRLVRCIEVNMVVDEWERMNRENSILPKDQRQNVPKLEDMKIHNWQAAAIVALHEAAEAHLLSK